VLVGIGALGLNSAGGAGTTDRDAAPLGCRAEGTRYVGTSDHGRVCFTITSDRSSVREWAIDVPSRVTCSGGAIVATTSHTVAYYMPVPIGGGGSFNSSPGAGTSFSGTVTGSTASGTVRYRWVTEGHTCDTGTFHWSAHAGHAAAAPPTTRLTAVIGAPTTIPKEAVAGRPFIVTFPVKRNDNGAALKTGRMICDPSVAGTVIRHNERFKNGEARLAFVIPASAKGKLLKLRVTIKVGTSSSTRLATFRVKSVARPSPPATPPTTTATPPSTPTPTPPAPAPQPPPPAPAVQPGMYCGFHNFGGGICFNVASDLSRIDKLRYSFDNIECSDGSSWRFWLDDYAVNVTLTAGKFSVTFHSDKFASGEPAQVDIPITGTIDTAGNAAGTIRYTADFGGRQCDSNPRTWTAQLGR
jgi:hypothetical protein